MSLPKPFYEDGSLESILIELASGAWNLAVTHQGHDEIHRLVSEAVSAIRARASSSEGQA